MIAPCLLFGFVAFLLLAIIAADEASGHMPFSGYWEERIWGRVSTGSFIAAGSCFGSLFFV